MRITKDDILKLSQISMIDVSEADIGILIERIDTLLNYVSRLKWVVSKYKEQDMPHNTNIFRPDQAIKKDPEPLLNLAPSREDNYFVVPMIFKKSLEDNIKGSNE